MSAVLNSLLQINPDVLNWIEVRALCWPEIKALDPTPLLVPRSIRPSMARGAVFLEGELGRLFLRQILESGEKVVRNAADILVLIDAAFHHHQWS